MSSFLAQLAKLLIVPFVTWASNLIVGWAKTIYKKYQDRKTLKEKKKKDKKKAVKHASSDSEDAARDSFNDLD